MFNPLRPALYQQLKVKFGEVKVVNAGVEISWSLRTKTDAAGGQRTSRFFDKARGDNWGESYRVSCPFCNDRRFRLYISHMWGHRDLATGGENLNLCYCQNENCLSDAERQRALRYLVWGSHESLPGRDMVFRGKEVRRVLGDVDSPGSVWLLDRLPPEHEANVYIRGRRYDPAWLAKNLNVGYIWEPPSRARESLRHRILIPVYAAAKLIGWQARSIGNPREGESKYLFSRSFPRNLSLYNYDIARQYKAVAVVEGAMKVWRFGPDAVATWGHSVHDMQISLMLAAWTDLVFFAESDSHALTVNAATRAASRARVRTILLQSGQAPDDMQTAEVRSLFDRALQLPPGTVIESKILGSN